MSLSIYTHDNDSSDIKDTHKYSSCNFKIGISSKSLKRAVENLPLIQGQRITAINGVCDETIDVGYSTEWGESPGAKIADKLKGFTQSDAFKMFSSNVFNPNPVSNKWTQIYPHNGANIKVGLKFRAYYKANYFNTNSYMTIIPWLIFLTSPMTEFSLNEEITNIKEAVCNAEREGEQLAHQMEGISEENGTLGKKAIDALSAMEKAIENLATDSRGSACFTLRYGDVIKENDAIDWIISDWSFTPSTVMGPENNPLWVDFQINMETNQKLSFAKLKELFNFKFTEKN